MNTDFRRFAGFKLIGSAELLIVALTAFAISAKVRILPRRKVALLGGEHAAARAVVRNSAL